MTAIQPILILLLAAGTIYYFVRLRSALWDRLIVLLITAVGILFVVDPELSTQMAHLLGVGRGVDLLIYIGFFGVGFLLLLLFSKVRDLQERLTELARAVALANARPPAPPERAQER